jgi:hypothetical protein
MHVQPNTTFDELIYRSCELAGELVVKCFEDIIENNEIKKYEYEIKKSPNYKWDD